MGASKIDWNGFRDNYGKKSFNDVEEFYNIIHKYFPNQDKMRVNHFVEMFNTINLRSIKNKFKVVEVGSNNGRFAKEIIKIIPNIEIWNGYDFKMFDGTTYGKYRFIPLSNWFHKTELQEFNTFVCSHIIEHLSNNQASRTLQYISKKADYILLETPLTIDGQDWNNRWNAHILTWSVDTLKKFITSLGYYMFYDVYEDGVSITGWSKNRLYDNSKFVSWMCCTYKREKHLPNIIKSFINQNYSGKKEFVIINDDPDVNYKSKHPEIRIYNLPYKLRNLREKYNLGVNLCHGELFMPVADDDLYEPWAIDLSVREIKEYPFMAINGFWKKGSSGTVPRGNINGLYICRKEFFKQMGCFDVWDLDKLENGILSLSPENFMNRVRKTNHYREYDIKDKKDFFFTWVLGADHSGWHEDDQEKYIIKDRKPKIVEV